MSSEKVLVVKKLKRNFQVETTEGKYKFSEDTIIKYQIFRDREFTKEELEVILKTEEFNSYLNRAINYLSFQLRSVNEIKKYLVSKECPINLIDDITKKIIELGYLDDERLANSFLDYSIRNLKGPNFLFQKLKEKLIEEKLIKNTISKYSEEIEIEVIEELLGKIANKYKKYPLRKQKQLVYQKLLRDGFSNELINSALNKFEFNDDSDEALNKDFRKAILKVENLDYKEKQKIISKLLQKGYEYSKIQEHFNSLE